MILEVTRTHWIRPDRKWTFKQVAAFKNSMYRIYYDFMEFRETPFISTDAEYPIYNTSGNTFRYIADGPPTIGDIRHAIENVIGNELRSDEFATLCGVILAGTTVYVEDEKIDSMTITRMVLGAVDVWNETDPVHRHAYPMLQTLSKQLARVGIRQTPDELFPLMTELSENPALAYSKVRELRR